MVPWLDYESLRFHSWCSSSGASSQHCLCVCVSVCVCVYVSPQPFNSPCLPAHNPSPSSASLPKSPDTLTLFLSLPTTPSSYLPHTTSFLHLSSIYPSLHLIIPSKRPCICQKQHDHTVHPRTNSWVCEAEFVVKEVVVVCMASPKHTQHELARCPHTHTF
jgi:hypothetical protein